jgi:hypothetical protein
MAQIKVIGIHLIDRIKEAGRTQAILGKYGHCIKTRLGFHELNADVNSRNGFIILQLIGNEVEWIKLETELENIDGLEVKSISFDQ